MSFTVSYSKFPQLQKMFWANVSQSSVTVTKNSRESIYKDENSIVAPGLILWSLLVCVWSCTVGHCRKTWRRRLAHLIRIKKKREKEKVGWQHPLPGHIFSDELPYGRLYILKFPSLPKDITCWRSSHQHLAHGDIKIQSQWPVFFNTFNISLKVCDHKERSSPNKP